MRMLSSRSFRLGGLLRTLAFTCLLGATLAPSAHAGWGATGIPATRAPRVQSRPVAVTDGAGGMVVAWIDTRSGYNSDVYAQRILPVGSIGAGWTTDGTALTRVTCTKYDLALTSDGAGGAIATWADVRCPPGDGIARLYAQRVRANGTMDPAWPVDGRALSPSATLQEKPAITGDGAGGAYVVWNDRRSGFMALYATRVTSAGVVAPGWPANGLLLSSTTRDTCAAAIAPDGAGGALVSWVVPGPANDTLKVQRITSGGAIAAGWPAGGAVACAAAGRRDGVALAASAGGDAWLAWVDWRGGDADVYATRIAAGGAIAAGWSASGAAIASGTGAQRSPAVVAAAGDRGVFAWSDGAAAGGADVRAKSFDAAGATAPGWPAGGRTVCAAAGDQVSPLLAADGTGGFLVAWTDSRDLATLARDLYLQRLAADGSVAPGWASDGFPLCTQAADQSQPALVPDGAGGALGAWTDTRNFATSDLDLYANRLGADGPLPTQIRNLAALHHDGQTFLTGTAPATTGYVYRFYRSESPITSTADLANATMIGSPMDSSWCAQRLSQFMGRTYAHCIDSLAAPLDSMQVLFVTTPTLNRTVYYAATAQATDAEENRAITPGSNALAAPVQEFVNRPRPVFQREIRVHDQPTRMYTLWTASAETPWFPAMSNRPSMPFDCAIRPGYSSLDSTSLLVRPATRNLYCLDVIWWTPGYWLMSFDDLLPAVQGSFYFGYHEGFDLTLAHQSPPTGGIVHDYTRQRIVFMLGWARRNFPVDTTRVYAFGYSLAGAAAATLTYAAPGWIAGAQSISGHYDFSYSTEPVAGSSFNPGQYYDLLETELWGSKALNLPTSAGGHVYELTNLSYLSGAMEPVAVPPLVSFDGRQDTAMGWAEKVNYYRAMQHHRQGGTFFWDQHVHNTDLSLMYWLPMIGPSSLWRYETDRSFPALSHCSADQDPGDGTPASGDTLGTINGYVQWDSLLVDQPGGWSTTLRPRDLVSSLGPRPAPDSFTVDVTPRRLQAFHPVPGQSFPWRAMRIDDDAIVQTGVVVADSLARLTIEAVRVYRGGTLLSIGDESLLGVPGGNAPPPARLALSLARNPVRGAGEAFVSWTHAGEGRVDLLDVTGRRVATLQRGPVAAGTSRVALGSHALRPGLYWVVASDGRDRVTKRVVVLR